MLLDKFLLLLLVVRQVLFCNDGDQNKFAFIHFTRQGWTLTKQTHWTGMGTQFNNSLAHQDMLGLARTQESPASLFGVVALPLLFS